MYFAADLRDNVAYVLKAAAESGYEVIKYDVGYVEEFICPSDTFTFIGTNRYFYSATSSGFSNGYVIMKP